MTHTPDPLVSLRIPRPLWAKVVELAKAEKRAGIAQLAIILEAHFAEREKASREQSQ